MYKIKDKQLKGLIFKSRSVCLLYAAIHLPCYLNIHKVEAQSQLPLDFFSVIWMKHKVEALIQLPPFLYFFFSCLTKIKRNKSNVSKYGSNFHPKHLLSFHFMTQATNDSINNLILLFTSNIHNYLSLKPGEWRTNA